MTDKPDPGRGQPLRAINVTSDATRPLMAALLAIGEERGLRVGTLSGRFIPGSAPDALHVVLPLRDSAEEERVILTLQAMALLNPRMARACEAAEPMGVVDVPGAPRLLFFLKLTAQINQPMTDLVKGMTNAG